MNKTEQIRTLPKKEIQQMEAIKLFAQIRDIPYALGADSKVESILEENKGGCARKHLYLMPKLKKLGYKVELGISQFDWRDLPIPVEILFLLKQPIQYHMFLYVNNQKIDATWDKGMKKLGFPVYDWNGLSSTGLTVDSKVIKRRNASVLKCRSAASSILKEIKGESNIPTPFNDAFNEWLVNNR